ncbi:MAG: hypothetical protein CL608_31295 [Anaerolineaceae bacterium]|nr:hypothetical protein [Anaerolineaceae bacterium]
MNDSWQIAATTLTPKVRQWLRQPTAVSLLHLFDQAINLIDANGTVIAIVQPSIGAGPFSIVVNEARPFPPTINPSTIIHKTANSLHIGPLHIDLRPAELWQPAPNWELLRHQQKAWLTLLPEWETAVSQQQDRLITGAPVNFAPRFQAATGAVREAIAQPGASGLETAVAHLAGLGPGLTPAGDDFLLGLLLGLWATRSEAEVVELGKRVVETAVPRTTQLSAAWLQAAAQGEAWLAWHNLLAAMRAGDHWQQPFNRILNNGATSGIAALMGFIAATAANCHQTTRH